MNRGDLSKRNWCKIRPILPAEHSGQKGHPYRGHRKVINGILWRLRTGAPWRDIPKRYGPWQTCYDRFVRFRKNGLWQTILELLQAEADSRGQLDWQTGCADGSVIRAHQHAAGASEGLEYSHIEDSQTRQAETQSLVMAVSEATPPKSKEQVQARQALGYSQGGFSTKLHIICEGQGRPLAATLSPGQAHESKYLQPTLEAVRVPRQGRGRPKKHPK
jgi:transposase